LLIERIQARDFMRFRALDIRGLPPAGAVAVVGPNESGKSAIGEAISFALFGATPRAPADRARRVIRWGAHGCRVELTFSISDRGRYTVVREMDREGVHGAWLKPADADLVLAEGAPETARELFNLLGFRSDEFRYSFYLAQNELDMVDARRGEGTRGVIYRMLGIDILERAARRVQADLEALARSLRSDREELRLSRALIETSGFDPSEARTVGEETARLRQEQEGRLQLVKDEEAGVRLHGDASRHHETLMTGVDGLHEALRAGFLRDRFLASVGTLGGFRKALREASARAQDDLRDARARHEERERKEEGLAGYLKERDRLLDLVRFHAGHLKRELTTGTGGEGRSLSTMEALEEMRGRIASDRRDQWIATAQAVAAGALGGLCALLAYGFGVDAPVVEPLAGILAASWQIPSALTAAGIFAALLAFAAFRWISAGRSLANNLGFEERLEEEVHRMRMEAEALDAVLSSSGGRLKENLSFVSDPDIQRQGQKILAEFAGWHDQGAAEATGKAAREELARSAVEVEAAEAVQRRIAALSAQVERRVADLVEGRPEAAARAEAAPPAALESLEGVEAEADRASERARELRGLLAGIERDGSVPPPVDLQWEDVCTGSEVLLEILERGIGHIGPLDLDRFRAFAFGPRPETTPKEFLAALDEEVGRLRSAFPSAEEMRERRERVRYDLDQERAKLAGLTARIEGLEREHQRLAPRLKVHEELRAKIALLEARLGPLEHDLAVRRALADLLAGTVAGVKGRFGPALGRFVGSILPTLTRDRYGKIQVSADLDVAVFSRERNDYVGFEEISGGTRDQVLLCLRLALAQALLQARMALDRRQFLFLDEPVSSFDEERSLRFLDLVKGFSANFQQIFVTLHMLSTAPDAYQGTIRTRIDSDVLEADLS